MVIREFRYNDIPIIQKILIGYLQNQNQFVSKEKAEKIKHQLISLVNSETKLTMVAENNDKVVGYLNAHVCPVPLIGGTEIYISELFIDADFRGLGIGSSLLKYIENYAKEKGCIRLMLNCFKDSNTYKRKFYPMQKFEERYKVANYVKYFK